MIRILSIGVENYQDPAQHTVAFAENDAVAVAQAWHELSLGTAESLILTSAQATRGRVLHEVTTLRNKTASEDIIIFYFAGHGFNTGTANLLSVNDTFMSTLTETAIPFETVYGTLAAARPQKLMLFLDACHSGFELRDARGTVRMFSADELRMIDRDADVAVSFASCSQDEESYPYPAENHGCWTFHLLRVLRGEEPGMLYEGSLVRAIALQEHLGSEVPALVRRLRRGTATQRPRLFGSINQDSIVADLQPLLASRHIVQDHFTSIADHVALVGLEVGLIRKLSGFQKWHHIPKQVDAATKRFVSGIASTELEEVKNELWEALHSKLGVRYSDMDVHESDDGFRIICPAFDVQVDLSQSDDDPSEYEIRTCVDDFRDPSVLSVEGFAAVFEDRINQIEVSLIKREDLGVVVKRLEASRFKDDVKYERDRRIVVQLEESPLCVEITPHILTLSVKSGGLRNLLAIASDGLASISAESVISSLPSPGTV